MSTYWTCHNLVLSALVGSWPRVEPSGETRRDGPPEKLEKAKVQRVCGQRPSCCSHQMEKEDVFGDTVCKGVENNSCQESFDPIIILT